MTFTKKETEKLKPFFSNLTKNVFVLTNMPQILMGALFSRYSRSSKSLRTLFLEEYLKSEDLEKEVGAINFNSVGDLNKFLITEKAEKFYSKWLAEYGDDSIAELGGVHVGIEDVSVLTTKSMEDRRIGLSPLEKSTRYVRFDDKVNGKYKYYRDEKIMKSKYASAYIKTMNLLFDTYSQMLDPMMDFFRKKYPKPQEVSDKAYESSIRAKACDSLRGLLPLSTLTNMGLFGNGRAYEYMITKMLAADLDEVKTLANDIYGELDKTIHNFIERIKTEKGENYIKFLKETENAVKGISKKFCKSALNLKKTKTSVTLLGYDKDALDKTVACILYSNSNQSLEKLLSAVKKMSSKKKNDVIKTYAEKRLGRWHKIGRAFEEPYYHFEIISDFGAYKDLERHRLLTQDKQLFSCDLGYDVPDEVAEAGFLKKYEKAMNETAKLYEKLFKIFPLQAQYLVTHGYKVRYRMKMNLREAFHLCELRSSPQGHPNYRFIAQEIYRRIKEVHPIFGETMRYVNMGNPGLERLSAEIRKEQKLSKFV